MKLFALSLSLIAASVAQAGVMDDVLVTYTASANDTYFKGEPIVGKACYALVWTAKGKTFAGFNSDGSLSAPDQDDLFAAIALDRGETCDFLISKDEYDLRRKEGWTMAVYLLDTRDATGVAVEPDSSGRLSRVSRWGLAVSSAAIFTQSELLTGLPVLAQGAETMSDLSRDEEGSTIAITSVSVDGDDIVIESEGGSPTCTYAMSSGATTDSISGADEAQDGNVKRRNLFRMKGAGKSRMRFFRLKRVR